MSAGGVKLVISAGARGPELARGRVAGGRWQFLGPFAKLQRLGKQQDLLAESERLSGFLHVVLGVSEV